MKTLEEPECQDKDGNHAEFESEAYGCDVTSKITQPDMVFLGNESGGNIDVTGDGHIGRHKLIIEKRLIVQRNSTKKKSHLLGLQTYLIATEST